jgi:hypothetical protein
MDEFDIAQEIRIERQVHKGSFLLLEGDNDLRRFSKFTDAVKCSTVNCFGRSNLIGAVQLLYEDGFLGALGLADADFDRLTNTLLVHEGIIFSESHDFDLDCACEAALQRYLEETGDATKCDGAGGPVGVAKWVIGSLRPLSILRFVNVKEDLGYKLDDINHVRICVPQGDVIDIDLMIEHVSEGRFSAADAKNKLREKVVAYMRRDFDLQQLTNGHDFFAILGIALRNRLGGRLPPQTFGSEVEMHFRLGYSHEEFGQTQVFRAICDWEDENQPYVILKPNLRRLH